MTGISTGSTFTTKQNDEQEKLQEEKEMSSGYWKEMSGDWKRYEKDR